MRILAIETSCDDTGIAILQVSNPPSRKASARQAGSFKVLSSIVFSQIEVHKKYGGVYPMMAKREHQKNLVPVLTKALKESNLLKAENTKVKPQRLKIILEREPKLYKKIVAFLQKYKKPDLGLIAVTNGPGLEPCLWVGVNFAKALSYYWDIPIVPVNHIESHILVNFLGNSEVKFPAIALIVSGGHTELILMRGIGKYKILGETRDDAAGECFDKCAKILGLSYPGGPEIARLAKLQTTRYKLQTKLPRPMINTKDYDFSFSGLKTAVLYAWQKEEKGGRKFHCSEISDQKKIAFATEIQQAIIDVLLKKTFKAVKDYKAKTLFVGGGVSANKELRKQFQRALTANGSKGSTPLTPLDLLFPPVDLSTDNALMAAVTGYFHRNKKIARSDLAKLRANANLRISK